MHIPTMLTVGLLTLFAFYVGRGMKYVRLPSIIGFMLVGVVMGPSAIDLVTDELSADLGFITEIALGFVALSIGLELSLLSLKRQGRGIIIAIFAESFLAFALVTLGVYALTRDLPLALIFGAIAPASAPAGTVAVIQEYNAKGSLTKALYAVVGFDDGLGIIIFGFASAIASSLIAAQTGAETAGFMALIGVPLKEVVLSLTIGGITAFLFCFLVRKTGDDGRTLLILTFATVLIVAGLSTMLHLSLILTQMVVGMVAVNTQPQRLIEKISHQLKEVMPLLFVLFFGLAGANLHLMALPALGVLGVVYAVCRSAGLIGGAWLGSIWGKLEEKIRRNLGLGILSQAGVAIGLALSVKQDFAELGPRGVELGATVITTVTATCIFFELIGPICTRIALARAGEIAVES